MIVIVIVIGVMAIGARIQVTMATFGSLGELARTIDATSVTSHSKTSKNYFNNSYEFTPERTKFAFIATSVAYVSWLEGV